MENTPQVLLHVITCYNLNVGKLNSAAQKDEKYKLCKDVNSALKKTEKLVF